MPGCPEYPLADSVRYAGEGSVDIVTTPVGRITFDSASYQLCGDTGLSVLVGVPRTDEDRRLVEKLLSAGR